VSRPEHPLSAGIIQALYLPLGLLVFVGLSYDALPELGLCATEQSVVALAYAIVGAAAPLPQKVRDPRGHVLGLCQRHQPRGLPVQSMHKLRRAALNPIADEVGLEHLVNSDLTLGVN
jgi:hypothetical protein